jgi:hypothetical protein
MGVKCARSRISGDARFALAPHGRHLISMRLNSVADARERRRRQITSKAREALYYEAMVLSTGTELSLFAGNADNRVIDRPAIEDRHCFGA